MTSSPGNAETCKVWILDVDRWGDTQQMRTLAEAAPGVEYSILHLSSRKGFPRLRRFPRHSIGWLDAQSRALLRPPWPDAVFLAGRTAVSVALWIRRQNPATRLVAFGRPFAPFRLFDLVLSNAAYFPPSRPNVLRLRAPLHVLDAGKMQAMKRKWQARLKHLPRPYITLLAGGRSSPYRFDPEEAARLGRQVSALATRHGGSVLVATNYRLPPQSASALFEAISAPTFLHDCRNGDENPYLAFLALADTTVVTIDSLSMMTEAASTGSNVLIYPLERERNVFRDRLDDLYDLAMKTPLLAPVHALLRGIEAQGVLLRRADRHMFASWLVENGHARWFSVEDDLGGIEKRRPLQMQDELDRAVQRLSAILRETT